MKRILLVEDDPALTGSLVTGLNEAGYEVDHASRLGEIDSVTVDPDLVLLDLGLPDGDGMTTLDALQQRNPTRPVVILTARDGVTDRVAGLDHGAADYILKPFAMPELLARIRTHLRRSESSEPTAFTMGPLHLNLLTRGVTCGEEALDLPPREFDLLTCLIRSAGRPVSREQIARDVWQSPKRMTSLDNLIDVHISRLRDRLGALEGAPALRTLRGVGYQLEERP